MDRTKHRSFTRLTERSNFPALKASLVMSKAMIGVSRVDLDSRVMTRESFLLKTPSKQLEHTRTNSGVPKKIEQRKHKSISRQIAQRSKPVNEKFDKFKSSPAPQIFYESQREFNKKQQSTKNVLVEKSRISSKSYGYIKSYAANSHPGPLNTNNEDRVCIVTNLNKTSDKQSQVSFFAIYDGNNGSALSDYMRDCFHAILIQDSMFWRDIEQALKNTLKKVQKNFYDDPAYAKDTSSVSFVMLVIIGQTCYYAQMGEPKIIISKNLGSQRVKMPQKQSNQVIKNKGRSTSVKRLKSNQILSKQTLSNLHNINYTKYRAGKQILIKKISFQEDVDFILLGSQGVYENYKEQDLMRKTWASLLRANMLSASGTIHGLTGEAVNQLMSQIVNGYSTKNVSIILLTLNSVADIMKLDDSIVLPHHRQINENLQQQIE